MRVLLLCALWGVPLPLPAEDSAGPPPAEGISRATPEAPVGVPTDSAQLSPAESPPPVPPVSPQSGAPDSAAQAVPDSSPPTTPDSPPPTAPGTRLRRQSLYEGLWPFYTHEEFEDGSRSWKSLLGVVKVEEEPTGDYHHRVLPFYSASLTHQGTDRRLALFPLLYFGRRSPEEDHDYVLPLFYRWNTNDVRHTILWPLFRISANETRWFPPTLFRHAGWDGSEESRQRLGIQGIFEVFEHLHDERQSTWTIGSFFNFSGETAEGLPMARLSLSKDGSYHTHLFPLFYVGRDASAPSSEKPDPEAGPASSSYFITPAAGVWSQTDGKDGFVLPWLLTWSTWWESGYSTWGLWPFSHFYQKPGVAWAYVFPLYFSGSSASPPRSHEFFSLFYGTVRRGPEELPERIDRYFPALLSHYGTTPEGWSLNVLWPLGHYSEEGDRSRPEGGTEGKAGSFAVRALPFYDRKRDPSGESLGVGGLVYRRYEGYSSGTLRQWVLCPLVHWETSPHGDVAWAFPVFYHKDSDLKDVRTRTTIVFPSYVSYEKKRVWTIDGSDQAAETKLPGSTGRVSSGGTHFWPLFGYDEEESLSRSVPYRPREEHVPEQPQEEDVRERPPEANVREEPWEGDVLRTYSTLYPLLRVTNRYGPEAFEREEDGARETWIHAPWPMVRYREDRASWDFRAIPTIFLGDAPARTYAYLYPLVSVEEGARAEANLGHWTSLVQWYDGEDWRHFHLFPLLFRWREKRTGETSVVGLVYLLYYRSAADGGWFHLLPLGFGQWKEDRVSFGIFPLYLHRDHGEGHIDYWNPARFFFLWNTFLSQDESHWSFFWKLVERTSAQGGDYDFRILHRLLVIREVKGQSELTFNPFFSSVSDERTGRSSFSILKFLYTSETEGGKTTRRVLFITVSQSDAKE